jgi:hypothetical protein
MTATPALNLLMEEPPGPASQFIEAETDDGRSVSVGRWSPTEPPAGPTGSWRLRIEAHELVALGPVSFAARIVNDDEHTALLQHVSVRIYAGPDPDHRATVGVLQMRRDEAAALIAVLGEAQSPDTAPRPDGRAWSCPACGSSRWVSVSFDRGFTRKAQCVPCGTVGPLPERPEQ